MTNRFFSYAPNLGYSAHPTAEAARAEAEAGLDLYRDCAGDGWPDGVDEVCWGEIRQSAVRGPARPVADDDLVDRSAVDYVCDYTLEAPHA